MIFLTFPPLDLMASSNSLRESCICWGDSEWRSSMALGLASIKLGSMLAGMKTPGGIFSDAGGATRG